METCECAIKSKGAKAEVVILVYVDDLVILSLDMDRIKQTKKELQTLLMLPHLGEQQYCFEVSFKGTRNKNLLRQAPYCRRSLQKFLMESAKSTLTPMIKNIEDTICEAVVVEAEQEDSKHFPFQSLIGRLIYLGRHTRPDIAFPVGTMSRLVENAIK